MSDYHLSVDVEDWFHTHNLAPAVPRDTWGDHESRVGQNVSRLLELFDQFEARATFFVLGWVAEQYPDVVTEIDAHGHRIACHGYNHKLLYEQSPEEVRADVVRALEAIEPLTDQRVVGYRAPSFSITDQATEVLAELGFEYDSSLYRVDSHDRYGSLTVDSSAAVAELDAGITEVQLPVARVAHVTVPCAGGAYFRLLPYPLYKRLVRRTDGPFVFYLHPWEIDPEQPYLTDVPLSNRLRHYTNLGKTEGRLRRLLADFDWTTIESALDNRVE